MYSTSRNLKERLDVRFVECEEDLSSRTRVKFYLGKCIGKIEHEEIGSCAGIEISQDADHADQKIKWFPKVHKHTFVGSIFFNYLFSQVFIKVHILHIFQFSPLGNESFAHKSI